MNVPKLRFKEFNGEWEEKTLGEVTKVVSFKNKEEAQLPIYSINNKIGFVPQEEQFENVDGISRGYDTSLYKVVIPNMFAYNPARINVGSIGYSANLSNVMISSLYVCFVLTGDNDDMFYWQWFKSVKFNVLVNRFTEGGVRQYLFYENLSRIKMLAPACSEQEKIAMFLNNIDLRISNQKSIVESLEKQKKGLMQKIFSQKLRFKDDKGEEFPDWEDKKLGEIFEIKAGGDIDKNHVSKTKEGNFIYPIYANALINEGIYGYSDIYKIDNDSITVTGRGDIGVAKARFGKFYPIVRLLVLIPKETEDMVFFENLINYTKKYDESTGVPQLTVPQLSKIKVKVPSFEEQFKIGELFRSLDAKMEKGKMILKHWQQIKKGLLQQMFV